MDIERGFLEVLFKKIPYSELYQNNKVNKETFCKYSNDVFPQYSDDEKNNIFDYFDKQINRIDGIGILLLVADVADKLLTYNERDVQCKYDQILRWRHLSFQLGQDLFTTAYLAKHNIDFNQKTEYFAWSPIIKTDNKRLHNILDRGMAENHFHLTGSTQIFTLSWVCLMNHITQRSKDFNKIKSHLDHNPSNQTGDKRKNSLYTECMRAAFIRVHLFAKTHNIEIIQNANELSEFDSMYVGELQRLINAYQFEYSAECTYGYLDYAYEKSSTFLNSNNNRMLVGERKFLYDCFHDIFLGKFTEREKSYFLIYLKIKGTFRHELVQTNGRIGFKNFSDYQDRKEIFIENYPKYKHELIRLALNSTLDNQNIVSLEARVCPKGSLNANIKMIENYDYQTKTRKNPYEVIENKINSADKDDDDFKQFYVFHFPKQPDNKPFLEGVERSASFRKKLAFDAKTILALLETDRKSKYRVKGIDACANEIGCRPEVFAQVFRYLAKVNVNTKSSLIVANKPIIINATYHVGEDFLDIADGLRAIDEVTLFCDLKRGSRLGHALALGIDVLSYYKFKNFNIILCKQDIMDNISWLIGKASEYGIPVNSVLLSSLEQTFNEFYNDIYSHCIDINITMQDYYNAWKLRGDNPRLFLLSDEELRERLDNTPLLQSEYFEVNKLVSNSIRLNQKCRNLYYNYHFDRTVRERGKEVFVFQVDIMYAELVRQIQIKMQFDIARKGISIESNPSSNYLISTIQRYDQHPIIKLNNAKLTIDALELKECPLLSVSVNTDDQGVFDTLLENEYALLSQSLEKSKNDNGDLIYKPAMVYEWIDHIRKLGLEQVF